MGWGYKADRSIVIGSSTLCPSSTKITSIERCPKHENLNFSMTKPENLKISMTNSPVLKYKIIKRGAGWTSFAQLDINLKKKTMTTYSI
jgi:hypothetical protein